MADHLDKQPQRKDRQRSSPTATAVLGDGRLVELVYDPARDRTGLAVWQDGEWRIEQELAVGGARLVPYSPWNNLIRNNVVVLPAQPQEYGSEGELAAEVRAFIHRYVDVSPRFERLASYFVLLTWVYDRFNELPYLRLRGDYGSGKTRFLLTVGALCNKATFASGASTVSPLFHTLERFRGTLILDESDFRFSNEKADIVKILNNGNVRGMPVLRTEVTAQHEYNPRAFHVFGPKIIATRGYFDDRALESRFVTEETGGQALRDDIPIALPDAYRDEALELRNKLLLYRFRTFARIQPATEVIDPGIEPRLNQIFMPLAAIVGDISLIKDIRAIARAYHRDRIAERGLDVEAQVLAAVRSLADRTPGGRILLRDIAAEFERHHGTEYDFRVSPKWVGTILRRKLQIRTHKSNGVYVIPVTERQKLQRLYAKYGIDGDVGEEKSLALGQ